MTTQAVLETDFKGLKLIKRGKVRDIYDLDDSLLLVASDRISAFDAVMPEAIPDKGKILNKISLFWFENMKSIVANHIISGDVEDFPDVCKPHIDALRDRSMLVKKTEPLSIECVVRGYISGSGWKSYKQDQGICGIELSSGLSESEKLPNPIFTPSTKEDIGHDINIDFEHACDRVGKNIAEKVRELSLAIYEKGAQLALEKGIIIADTKFEFGILKDEIILIDEVLTPDSSRFWPLETYKSGGPQKSFDKQYLRDYLVSINWDKKPPAPHLPENIVNHTRAKYVEAYRLLTGCTDEF
ncbi:MAG: phosphoribosylaminoimidazolesuccinocarboxamide synthase [Desulfobacteraceae bacterium]|nr:phosphoribosylaminoimidazolesuccinocarboxamide synthase [Desulfobacteraceae bacterium]